MLGSVLSVDGVGVLGKGALEIRAECPALLLDAPLHAPPMRDTLHKWRAVKKAYVSYGDEVDEESGAEGDVPVEPVVIRKKKKTRKVRPFSIPFEPLQNLTPDTLSLVARAHAADMIQCLEMVCDKPVPNKPVSARSSNASTHPAGDGAGAESGLSYLQCRLVALLAAAARLPKMSGQVSTRNFISGQR